MTKGFVQKIVNALKSTSDEYVDDKINTKLNPDEKILARKIRDGINELRTLYQGKPMEIISDVGFQTKLLQIQTDISKQGFQIVASK